MHCRASTLLALTAIITTALACDIYGKAPTPPREPAKTINEVQPGAFDDYELVPVRSEDGLDLQNRSLWLVSCRRAGKYRVPVAEADMVIGCGTVGDDDPNLDVLDMHPATVSAIVWAFGDKVPCDIAYRYDDDSDFLSGELFTCYNAYNPADSEFFGD